jgi:Zn finger protein HypA/HybF involved in hydrogenase expression
MSIAVAAENGTLRAGQSARGDFRCADCGYGVTIRRVLPACPMCRGEDWDAWPAAGSQAPPVRLGVR